MFTDAGMAVMAARNVYILVDAGPFGPGSGGHSHSDTLSVTARAGGQDILIDPGTYTYIADAKARNWFRGSAAHNTVRIDGKDQAVAAGPFRWAGRPEPEIREWIAAPGHDYLDAVCRFEGFAHRRRVLFIKPDLLFVVDEIEGPEGEHAIEQFWHFGGPAAPVADACFRIGGAALLVLPQGDCIEFGEGGEHGWRSACLGSRQRAPVMRVSRTALLHATLAAAL
ncbi:MAG: heparinase II/III-family protein, partial [Acidobacteria bacterium]|nr:heparinase II/III-family protein [Acidobacteriota bacterium]